jgi:hypothetical protein
VRRVELEQGGVPGLLDDVREDWIALAPVPTTATRRPVRSWSCRQAAEWNAVPAKSSRPVSSGTAGRLSCPHAVISTSHSALPPSARSSTHFVRASSNRSAVSCRYAWISSCGG